MTTTIRSPENAIDIVDPRCLDLSAVGRKAEALARAQRIGLPVLEAMVLTTGFAAEIDAGGAIGLNPAIDAVMARFGDRRLVVRSSSVAEDAADSSLAGRLESVLDVSGRDEVVEAVRRVLDSRARAAEGTGLGVHDPIAVLIQPFVQASRGGVIFGVDPVTGRSDRLLLVSGDDPDEVVSGRADGTRNDLDLDGNRTDSGPDDDLPADLRTSLANLARRAATEFGGPQDLEWLVDAENELWLLQSRPVTTQIRGVPEGPLYGPGPVAETFPDPLSSLEADLWLPPLRSALREALVLAGAAKRSAVESRPVVVAPGGRVAVDLEITGELQTLSLWNRLSPIRATRRLGSAWRIGQLRAALPGLAHDLIDQTDRELRSVGPLEPLSDRQLVALLVRSRQVLTSLHAHEILMGLLVGREPPDVSGASVALRVLHDCRGEGHDDAKIIAECPVVLVLAAPRIGGTTDLPATPEHLLPTSRSQAHTGVAGMRREALRVRVRWAHELTARAAWELGGRLAGSGVLKLADDVRDLGLRELETLVRGQATVTECEPIETAGMPPQGTFQFSADGVPIAVVGAGAAEQAVGAGGGTGTGIVTHDAGNPAAGSVLVVSTLRPDLAPVLPRLAGLVAEHGSPLAHLAILAREANVATVVRVADAQGRFTEGMEVEVDGITGHIKVAEPEGNERQT